MAKPTIAQLTAQVEMLRTQLEVANATIETARTKYAALKVAGRKLLEDHTRLTGEVRRKEGLIQVLQKRPTRAQLEEARA